jgi:hypothetical protein
MFNNVSRTSSRNTSSTCNASAIPKVVHAASAPVRKITQAEAYLKVVDLYKTEMKFDRNLRIKFDHMDGTTYVFQVYDQMPYWTATINWIEVTSTGQVRAMF